MTFTFGTGVEMHPAKKFFAVCGGLFLLALSWHLGAQNVQAQAPSNPIVACRDDGNVVFTANGDMYVRNAQWAFSGNVFAGSSVNVEQHTLGQLKARFRDPAPQGR